MALIKKVDTELGWVRQLVQKFKSRVAHTFILHLNVADFVRGADGYVSLKRYLTQHLLKDFAMVVLYDRSTGIHFLRSEMQQDFMQVINHNSPNPINELPIEPEAALRVLERMLRLSPEEASLILKREIKGNFAALIIGFAETIFPDGSITDRNMADRTNIVTMAKLAQWPRIEKSGNLIVMMTNNLTSISAMLRNAESNIETIKVPYPDLQQRQDFINELPKLLSAADAEKLEMDDSNALAAASAGLSRASIKDLAAQAVFLNVPLSVDFIWDRKGHILEQMSGGLLQIVRPDVGFDVIGGLDHIKRYLCGIAEAVRTNDILSVPQGVLMVGPPGTGKSVVAEAFAYELGFSLVKLRNLREMWHGQSERNQAHVFDLLEALAPVVVFEDEMDQSEQQRGNVFHGDSGVGARMAAEKMAFMADVSHRGRILWLAATNRPDLMDAAMLREGRFDDKIPFLPPDRDERFAIFRAIFLKMRKHAEKNGRRVEFKIDDAPLTEVVKAMENRTGAEIELIVHRAAKFARTRGSVSPEGATVVEARDIEEARADFIPSRDETEFCKMIDLALYVVNSASMIPPKYRDRARKIQSIKNGGGKES